MKKKLTRKRFNILSEKLSTLIDNGIHHCEFSRSTIEEISLAVSNALSSDINTFPLYKTAADTANKQIDLFDIVSKLPVIQLFSRISIKEMVAAYKDKTEVIHLNIGIGKGVLEQNLFKQLLSQTPCRIKKIIIIGVDIDTDSLEKSKMNLQRVISAINPAVEFVFSTVCRPVEEASELLWEKLSGTRGITGVISAYALHHVNNLEKRQEVLNMLFRFAPEVFLLVEPDSNHAVNNLDVRITEVFRHYGAIFQLIEDTDFSPLEKELLKQFFLREIDDVLYSDDRHRTEKHETADSWKSRLSRAGFKLRNIQYELHPVLTLRSEESHLRSFYKGGSLVAMFNCYSDALRHERSQ